MSFLRLSQITLNNINRFINKKHFLSDKDRRAIIISIQTFDLKNKKQNNTNKKKLKKKTY